MSNSYVFALPVILSVVLLNFPQHQLAHAPEALSYYYGEEEVATNEQEELANPEPEEEEDEREVVEESQTKQQDGGFRPAIIESTPWVHYTQDEVRLHPNLEPICKCEAGKQFHNDGTVVRGIVNPADIGMCQINTKYHLAAAQGMGYDIFTEEGNIRYANHLYAQQGAQPWFWSKPCHGQG